MRLYRNQGDGTFEDVTEPAGLLPHLGKGLGIAMWDFDGNGYPDIVVANDTRPNFVFMNQGNGTFREEGLAMRVAYDENGRARAGMGIDIADYANDGVPGIAIGNFAGEPMSLYRAAKDGFISAAEQAGIAAATTPELTFGLAFADMDLDGIQDLVVVNGHIEPDIARIQPRAEPRAAGPALPRDARRPVRRRDGFGRAGFREAARRARARDRRLRPRWRPRSPDHGERRPGDAAPEPADADRARALAARRR